MHPSYTESTVSGDGYEFLGVSFAPVLKTSVVSAAKASVVSAANYAATAATKPSLYICHFVRPRTNYKQAYYRQ